MSKGNFKQLLNIEKSYSRKEINKLLKWYWHCLCTKNPLKLNLKSKCPECGKGALDDFK